MHKLRGETLLLIMYLAEVLWNFSQFKGINENTKIQIKQNF